jgi:hypothetical protein
MRDYQLNEFHDEQGPLDAWPDYILRALEYVHSRRVWKHARPRNEIVVVGRDADVCKRKHSSLKLPLFRHV